MKALFYDPHKQDIFIEETPVPALQPNDVLLKMDMCGICGSDVVAWKGGFKRITEPVILGHEGVGYIADLNGLDNTGFKLGERVVLEPLDTCGQCDACKKGHYNVCEHFKIHGIDNENRHLVLLCKNETGYRNLVAIVSKAWTEGFYSKPRADMELLREHS